MLFMDTDAAVLCPPFLSVTVKYVRYHDNRETKLPQELFLTKEYDVKWDPSDGQSDWYFLEIDITK